MAMGWFPDSPLFPDLERLGWSEDRGDDFQDFRMEYYPKVRSLKNNLDPDQYKIYKDLRELGGVASLNRHLFHSIWTKKFETLENEQLRETMLEALDACANYGSDIGFEISPRNVATKNRKLILLDCFFIVSKLQ
jgi:hypothetical protein